MQSPGIYTILPECRFAAAFAAETMKCFGGDPLAFSQAVIFLPSRRACLSLREQFAELSEGKPLLLPSLNPLGDLDADEVALWTHANAMGGERMDLLLPVAPPSRRLLMLAELVWKFHADAFGHMPSRDHAVWLARALAHFLDEVEREELSFSELKNLVQEAGLASHWQQVVTFLSVLSEHYEPLCRERGLISAMQRRNQRFQALTKHWKEHPPGYPVIVAGSTGSNPAVAEFMRVVAKLPQGYIVLPGLDTKMKQETWEKIGSTHPQFTLKELLGRMGAAREEVKVIKGNGYCVPERFTLVSAALLPPEETNSWPSLTVDLRKALDCVEYIECANPDEEAQVIALILRDALESPEKTAALVTPDRNLARRVAAALKRFGIVIDDSGGKPLTHTEAGIFFRLVIETARSNAAPVPLLALLKHPLAHVGIGAARCRALARVIEKHVLRGTRPPGGFLGILARLEEIKAGDGSDIEDARSLLRRLEACLMPLAQMDKKAGPLEHMIQQHRACAESLATDDRKENHLWNAEGGEQLQEFLDELEQEVKVASPLDPSAYPGTMEALMAGLVWRPVYGQHPRLKILGTIEARLQSFDRVVLGGMNEKSWPPLPDIDPWMSRPMRGEFGLPSPERKISQTAHDFLMQWNAPELFITRPVKMGGAKMIESRWMARLRALVEGRGERLKSRPWAQWVHDLQRAVPVPAEPRPQPKPPLAARPRMLPATRIETLLRDPYGIYAAYILRLRKLEKLDKEPEPKDFGNLVHQALEQFSLREDISMTPQEKQDALIACGREVFRVLEGKPAHYALWWRRFESIAAWISLQEEERRPLLEEIFAEREGIMRFSSLGGEFALKARADRIEKTKDGSLCIVDYKTGALPSQTAVKQGYACQLPLEAVIAEQGGFPGIEGSVDRLEYWRLQGGTEGGEIVKLKDIASLKQKALEGLKALIARYDDPQQPYTACPRLNKAPAHNDYEHLERLEEWAGY